MLGPLEDAPSNHLTFPILRKRATVSTASPLPLQPLPCSTVSEVEARALKQQVANRLMEHRQRRPRHEMQPVLPLEGMPLPQRHRVADQGAERFAKRVS